MYRVFPRRVNILERGGGKRLNNKHKKLFEIGGNKKVLTIALNATPRIYLNLYFTDGGFHRMVIFFF